MTTPPEPTTTPEPKRWQILSGSWLKLIAVATMLVIYLLRHPVFPH